MNTPKNLHLTLRLLLVTATLSACGSSAGTPTAPQNPSGFTATVVDSHTVTLSWTGMPAGAQAVLERKANGGAYATLAEHLDASNWRDANLTAGTAYTYRLKASAGGVTSSGVERSVNTPTAATHPDFDLSVQPTTVSIGSGRSGAVSVNITRPADGDGDVTLNLEGDVVGSGADKVSGQFTTGAGGARTLTLAVGAQVPVGTYTLTVHGVNGSVERRAPLQLIVERWLLVDDDRSGNNWPQNDPAADSSADKFARAAMTATNRPFDVKVVPYSASGQAKDEPNGPSAQDLSRYSGVVWYTGTTIVHPLTTADQGTLRAFLDAPGHRALLFSPGFVRDASTNGATLADPWEAFQPLVTTTLGVDQVAYQGDGTFTLTGQAGSALQGLTLNVARSNRAALKPGANAQALLTSGADVIATGRTTAGNAGSSHVVLAAFDLGHLTQADVTTLLTKLTAY